MPKIKFDIDHVAQLAMLDLSDEERAKFQKQLPSIVAYVSKLHEIDTSKVDAKEYLTLQQNVFRADEVKNSDAQTRSVLIDSFPKKTGTAMEVPAIFDETFDE